MSVSRKFAVPQSFDCSRLHCLLSFSQLQLFPLHHHSPHPHSHPRPNPRSAWLRRCQVLSAGYCRVLPAGRCQVANNKMELHIGCKLRQR